MAGQGRQAMRSIAAMATRGEDRGHLLLAESGRTPMRPRRAVKQARQTLIAISPQPLVHGRSADAQLARHLGRRPAEDEDAFDEELAAVDSQPRPRMCHESLLRGWSFDTPNPAAWLSSVNDVLGNHILG